MATEPTQALTQEEDIAGPVTHGLLLPTQHDQLMLPTNVNTQNVSLPPPSSFSALGLDLDDLLLSTPEEALVMVLEDPVVEDKEDEEGTEEQPVAAEEVNWRNTPEAKALDPTILNNTAVYLGRIMSGSIGHTLQHYKERSEIEGDNCTPAAYQVLEQAYNSMNPELRRQAAAKQAEAAAKQAAASKLKAKKEANLTSAEKKLVRSKDLSFIEDRKLIIKKYLERMALGEATIDDFKKRSEDPSDKKVTPRLYQVLMIALQMNWDGLAPGELSEWDQARAQKEEKWFPSVPVKLRRRPQINLFQSEESEDSR